MGASSPWNSNPPVSDVSCTPHSPTRRRFLYFIRGCRQGSILSGAPGGACFPTTPHCKPVLLHPLLYAQAPDSCLWQRPLPPRMSSGSLPRSSTHTLPDSQPKHMWLFLHLPTSSQFRSLGSRPAFPLPPRPQCPPPHPIPYFLASLSLIHFPKHLLPALPPVAASSVPRPPSNPRFSRLLQGCLSVPHRS